MHPFKIVFGFVSAPFEKVFSVIGFHASSSLEFLSSIGDLKGDNERLLRDNVRLAAENAKLSDMEHENAMLRKQLDLLPRGKFSLKAAEVIGQDQQSAGNWLLIDKGSSDGLSEGMAVIVDQGAVVGRISELTSTSSKVIVLTSPESVVNATDAQTEARGIVRGQYGSGMVLDTVLQTDVLHRDDAVVTSGLGEDFPRGLLLGTIDGIRVSDDRLFQQATIVPAVKFSSLRVVFVIAGN